MSGVDWETPLSDPSPDQIEFELFVALLSQRDLTPHAQTETGRPKSSQLSETGGDNSGLASRRPAGAPVLESGPGHDAQRVSRETCVQKFQE